MDGRSEERVAAADGAPSGGESRVGGAGRGVVPPARDSLLSEGVLAKFLRYVRIDTQSDPAGPAVPTTAGQWDLSRLLAAEAEAMGLEAVRCDDHGIVTATLPANPPEGERASPARRSPGGTVGLLAHVDTSPAVSGRGVRPVVHRRYAGGPIALPGGPVLDPGEHPRLAEVLGSDIVTSDGTTLLGADDKAGVAEIMAAIAYLLAHPEVAHGPVRLGFTTDEETGRGIEHLDVAAFGADAAYTLDGGALGDIAWENFHAENLLLVVQGRSAHPGSARGQMVNALHLAATLVSAVPAALRPETTEGREGFIHIDELRGNVEEASLVVLLRDFDAQGLEAKRRWLEGQCAALRAAHPACRISWTQTGGYRNMRAAVERHPVVTRRALEAMRRAGVEPRPAPIRGGTDGARLSERGLPTPNLFAGGMNFHARTEWIPVVWMERAVAVLIELVRLWAEEGPAEPA